MLNITNHQGKANQNHNVMSSLTCQKDYLQITNSGENLGKFWWESGTLHSVGEYVKWYNHYEKQMEILQKIKKRTIIWPSNYTPSIHPKEVKPLIRKDVCIPMSVAALFTIAKI